MEDLNITVNCWQRYYRIPSRHTVEMCAKSQALRTFIITLPPPEDVIEENINLNLQ